MSERAKKQWMLAASAQTPGVLNVSARGADIRALLNAIALQQGVNIVPDATVTGLVTIQLQNAPFEEGIHTLLDVNGFQYTQQGSIYRVTRKPQTQGTLDVQMQEGRLTLIAEDADVRGVIRELGEKAEVNIVLDGPVQGTLTARFQALDIDAAVRSLFATHPQFLINLRDGVYHLSMRPARTTSQWESRISLRQSPRFCGEMKSPLVGSPANPSTRFGPASR